MKHGLAGTTRTVRRTLFFITLTVVLTVMSGCVRRSYNAGTSTQSISASQQTETQSGARININSASADDLESLPGIGKGLAARIIEHREKYGPFRKPEHLIIVRGISDKRFHALKDLITVE